MPLGVDPLALLVDELDGVAEVGVALAPAVRDAAVAEEVDDLVDRLGRLREVVPEHGRVVGASEMRARVPLLGVDEVRELGAARVSSNLARPETHGSRRKKTGVLLATMSQLPSSVFILIEKPRGSRAQSCEPDSPPTVEKRTVTGQRLPTVPSTSAMQTSSSDLVHSK